MNNQFTEMGNRIKSRRKTLQIRQAELAEALGISNNHMSSIETAKERPSMDIFIRICEELKVTPDYLLLGNMHVNDTPQNIVDNLRLCSKEDIELIHNIVNYMVHRNQGNWNNKYFM